MCVADVLRAFAHTGTAAVLHDEADAAGNARRSRGVPGRVERRGHYGWPMMLRTDAIGCWPRGAAREASRCSASARRSRALGEPGKSAGGFRRNCQTRAAQSVALAAGPGRARMTAFARPCVNRDDVQQARSATGSVRRWVNSRYPTTGTACCAKRRTFFVRPAEAIGPPPSN